MAKVEQPLFVLPQKRNGKKAYSNAAGHVDHIITVQATNMSKDVRSVQEGDNTQVKYKNGLSPVTEHESGIVQHSIENLKSSMKINLHNNDDQNDDLDDPGKIHIQKNGYQALSTNLSRELIDLSPIYENSSDACSSHGDCFENEEMQNSCKYLNEINDYTSATTSNSHSQTQSENSCEIGNLFDSLRSVKKENVNIVSEEYGNTQITTTGDSEPGLVTGDSSPSDTKDRFLNMTGTIKWGKKKSQQYDVKLDISREELGFIEAITIAEKCDKMKIFKCSLHNGLHIFLLTVLCVPFVTLLSAGYSFYIGTQVWHKVYLTFSNTFTWKTVVLLPLIVILYPFMIVFFNLGIGLYAGIIQLSFSCVDWWVGVCNFEKGFYGWLCNAIGLSECCPYKVVILHMDVKS